MSADDIISKIIADIRDRKGIGDEWESLDADIRNEIVAEWRTFFTVQSESASTAYQAVGYVKSLDGNTSTHYEPGRVPDGESMLYIVARRK